MYYLEGIVSGLVFSPLHFKVVEYNRMSINKKLKALSMIKHEPSENEIIIVYWRVKVHDIYTFSTQTLGR